jgi:carboxyl-terminal processing protease
MDEAKQQLVHRYEVLTKQTAEQDPQDLRASFLDAFATGLDPHSNYLSPDDAEEFDIQMGLSLEGIGLALSSRDGYAVVEEVIRGGAADRQGSVKRKDKIVAVTQEGGEPVKVVDYKLRDVVRMIRGPKGTPVTLTVLRPGDPPKRFQVTIVRDKIDLEEQAAKLHFEDVDAGGHKLKLAVLELPSFYGDRDSSKRQAERDVRNLLKQVREAKADGLLLDLSRNGGGLLDYAISISGFFVRDGGIVAVRPGKESPRIFSDPDDGILYSGPMVVLTSRVTASASEILAGALQDYHRAVVVGDDQTFGKGTVQSVMPLSEDLGKLKVTTAMFFRPGGHSTQLEGVHSDIVVPSLSNNEEYAEGAQPGALPSQTIPPYLPPRTEDGGFTTWQPVTPDIVTALTAKSKERVAKSEEFAKVNEDIAKVKKSAGVVELGEVMKAEDKGKADDDLAEADDKKPTPQLQEAVRILADYVNLQQEKLASTVKP